MSQPIVLISHNRIKEGRLEDLKEYLREGTKRLEAGRPQTVAFLEYVNDDGTELTIVHVFPDAGGMEAHMEGVQERAGAASEFMELVGAEIYGAPSDPMLETMRGFATRSGAGMRVDTEFLGGFLRLGSA
jgi:hypothetical protein